MLQQGYGRSIQIHAHPVYTILHHRAQHLIQALLVQIVLILADADGLRIDLHQLCQRVLEPSGNGNGAPLSHIKAGKLLCGQLTGRIYRRPCLVYDHIAHILGDLL